MWCIRRGEQFLSVYGRWRTFAIGGRRINEFLWAVKFFESEKAAKDYIKKRNLHNVIIQNGV